MAASTIERLSPDVVNRIAAGEVIQRPSAAIKELIENCLDAGATRIVIATAQSGLKSLSITDNGSGIRKDDMAIVCERFTTSKLRAFADLQSIETFGFRGEALASISHVAHVKITSKTQQEPCAYTGNYSDGRLIGECDLCAGVVGTQIVVENLFYNVPLRLAALTNVKEEYNRIVQVVTQYAIHYDQVAFVLKKANRPKPDVQTMGKSTKTDVLRSLYGQNLARELLPLPTESIEAKLAVRLSGMVSNANFSSKSVVFVLFINGRLVECSAIRKVIDAVYGEYLPRGSHPFVYLAIDMPSRNIDVNVHPTKREVGFLFESEICEFIESSLNMCLSDANRSRSFTVHQLNKPHQDAVTARSALAAPKDVVRTNASLPSGRLLAYLQHPELRTLSQTSDRQDRIKRTREDTGTEMYNLTSVRNLLEQVARRSHSELTKIIEEHTFVGCVDDKLVLVQHQTKLYLINIPAISEELMYQRCLKNFGIMRKLLLCTSADKPRPLLFELCMMCLDDPSFGWVPANGEKVDIARSVTSLLIDQREMLREYFSIDITQTGELTALPQLISKYVPPLGMLPTFILRLGTEVDWATEETCLDNISRQIANLYKVHPNMYLTSVEDSSQDQKIDCSANVPLRWSIENILLPDMTKGFLVPKQFASNGLFVQIASCENLYKIFERC